MLYAPAGESFIVVPGVVMLVNVVEGGAEAPSMKTSLGEMVCGLVWAETGCSEADPNELTALKSSGSSKKLG